MGNKREKKALAVADLQLTLVPDSADGSWVNTERCNSTCMAHGTHITETDLGDHSITAGEQHKDVFLGKIGWQVAGWLTSRRRQWCPKSSPVQDYTNWNTSSLMVLSHLLNISLGKDYQWWVQDNLSSSHFFHCNEGMSSFQDYGLKPHLFFHTYMLWVWASCQLWDWSSCLLLNCSAILITLCLKLNMTVSPLSTKVMFIPGQAGLITETRHWEVPFLQLVWHFPTSFPHCR